MKLKTITKQLMCCAWLAASVLSAHAADRLLIVGDAVWGGYSIDNSVAMQPEEGSADVFRTTVYLRGAAGFKFLTTTDWGNLEYRAGSTGVTLAEGEAVRLVSSDEDGSDNKFRVGESANYEVVCDLAQQTVTVAKAAFQTAPIDHPTLWMVGDATPGGWSIGDGTALVSDADNPLRLAARVSLKPGEFKFAVNNQTGYGQTFYVRDAVDETKAVFGGDDNKWRVDEEATYDVAIDLATLAVTISKLTPSAIAAAPSATADAPAEYFDLRGVRLPAQPQSGLCVKRQGGRTVKMVVR